jgi:VanZ family protein
LLIRGKNIPLIRTALFCTLITILLATLLELLQLALPTRSADWRDILWSTLGALTATLIPAFLLKPRRR